MASLSLRYGVPIEALRRSNGITSDHLLLARKTILIPGEFYTGGVSLSPRPIEGEEEERRKAILRKFQVMTKVSEYVYFNRNFRQRLRKFVQLEWNSGRWYSFLMRYRYDVALLYLQQYDYDLESAIETFKDDERWEKEHPIEAAKGKGITRHDVGRRRFTGNRS